uniref:Ku_PK_bind domain-containing protein n=1 Tax=Macrostomum lignano TaxID=282301 RepID=A0A1I8HUN0_9PLAT
ELGPDEIASAERAFQRLGLLSKKQACNAALLAKQDEAKKSAGGGVGATGKSAASAASVGASVAAELAGVRHKRLSDATRPNVKTAAATVSDCLAESLQLERRRAAIGDAWKPVVLELLLSCAKEVEDRQGCMRRQMNSFVLRQKQGHCETHCTAGVHRQNCAEAHASIFRPFKVITPCQT